MSKKIDFSKPLSADDAAYVADRPWLARDAELAGFEVQYDDDFTVETSDNENDAPSGINPEDTDLQRRAEQAASEASEDDESDDEESDEEEGDGLDELEFADLKEEAGDRGLSKAGSKEQLIARIREYDAENAESDDESEDDDSAE